MKAHHGLLITRGLQEAACLLAQDLPFATAARLLGWQTGEPDVLSASTVRTLVRQHGATIRRQEQHEAQVSLACGTRGQRLRGVPVDQARRRPGWPEPLSAVVEAALAHGTRRPPEGVTRADWARVQAARRAEEDLSVAEVRHLGPRVAPGQVMLALDEALTPGPGQGAVHEVRTACPLTAGGRRSLSGRGPELRSCARSGRQCRPARSSPCWSWPLAPAGSAPSVRTSKRRGLRLR